MRSGLIFKDPSNLNVAAGSNLTLRLVAKQTLLNVAGRKVWGDSYNGSFVDV